MTNEPVIVFVTYNSADVISDALEPLKNRAVQIVDNGSTDGTIEILEKFRNVEVHRSARNLGYGGAVNLAAALHPGRDICVLNPDVETTDEAVSILRAQIQHGNVGLAAPRLFNLDGSLQFSARNYQSLGVALATRTPIAKTRWGGRKRDWQHEPSLTSAARVVPWVTGAAMYFNRRAFDQIGGFDDRFFMYQEDQDICIRMQAAGWDVLYVPQATMTHGHARASARSFTAARRHLRSTVQLYLKHPAIIWGNHGVPRRQRPPRD